MIKKYFLIILILSIFVFSSFIVNATDDMEPEPTKQFIFIVKDRDGKAISDVEIGWNIQERTYWNDETPRYYAMHTEYTDDTGTATFEYGIFQSENPYVYWVKKTGYKTYQGELDVNDFNSDNINRNIQLVKSDSIFNSKNMDTDNIPGFELIIFLGSLLIAFLIIRKQ